MKLTPLEIVLAVGILVVVVGLAFEVRRWRAGTSGVTRRQKRLRVACASLVVVILAMMLAGDAWVAAYSPFAVMAYWTFSLGLAFVLVFLSLLDFRETTLRYGEERKRVFRNLAKPDEKDADDE